MPETALEIVRSNLAEHPAVLAWNRLQRLAVEPSEIVVLKKRIKSTVYRLADAGPGGSAIIAKYCRRPVALHERIVYGELLCKLPVATPHFYGTVPGDEEFDWLFLECLHGEQYSRQSAEHSRLAAEWLGLLHRSSAVIAESLSLPDRGPQHYLRHLQSAHRRLAQALAVCNFRKEESMIVAGAMSQCMWLESHWNELEKYSDRMPRTFVHGDFKPKNALVRRDSHSGAVFTSYDWEMSGWGVPAVDLAHVDIVAYHSVLKELWSGVQVEDLKQLALIGKIFRRLAAFDWESEKFDPRWEIAMEHMNLYKADMAGLIQVLCGSNHASA